MYVLLFYVSLLSGCTFHLIKYTCAQVQPRTKADQNQVCHGTTPPLPIYFNLLPFISLPSLTFATMSMTVVCPVSRACGQWQRGAGAGPLVPASPRHGAAQYTPGRQWDHTPCTVSHTMAETVIWTPCSLQWAWRTRTRTGATVRPSPPPSRSPHSVRAEILVSSICLSFWHLDPRT